MSISLHDGAKRRIVAIYGGTFDPVHIGHAMVVNMVSQLDGIDKVWMMPAGRNPLKSRQPVASDEERLHMCRLVADECDGVEVCDLELHTPQPSYTISTLRRLEQMHPDTRFVMIIGADNWDVIGSWREHEAIMRDFGFIIYPRPGVELDATALPEGAMYLEGMPTMDISSTFLRQRLAGPTFNARFLLPDSVERYVRETGIYTRHP